MEVKTCKKFKVTLESTKIAPNYWVTNLQKVTLSYKRQKYLRNED